MRVRDEDHPTGVELLGDQLDGVVDAGRAGTRPRERLLVLGVTGPGHDDPRAELGCGELPDQPARTPPHHELVGRDAQVGAVGAGQDVVRAVGVAAQDRGWQVPQGGQRGGGGP